MQCAINLINQKFWTSNLLSPIKLCFQLLQGSFMKKPLWSPSISTYWTSFPASFNLLAQFSTLSLGSSIPPVITCTGSSMTDSRFWLKVPKGLARGWSAFFPCDKDSLQNLSWRFNQVNTCNLIKHEKQYFLCPIKFVVFRRTCNLCIVT